MQLSNSVLRSYTPPTCSLEITARSSPLSRWMGQSVVKQLWFKLNLDDPRLPEDKRVTIQGDRHQLEILHEAVTTYVQNLLIQTPEQFNAVFAASPTSSDHLAPSTPDISSEPQLVGSESFPDANLEASNTEREIFLQPDTGLAHNLFLGSLANPETGRCIRLSVLQLFDLATALDQYAADTLGVPSLNRSRFDTTPPAWTAIAAGLVATIGLAAVGVQIFHTPEPQQTALTDSNQGANINNPSQTALQPLPVPTLASPGTLPPLPPPGSVSPSPLPTITIPKNPSPVIPQPTTSPRTSSTSPAPRTTVPPIVINPIPRQDQPVLIPKVTPSNNSSEQSPNSSAAPSDTTSPNFQISAPKPNLDTAISRASRGNIAATESQPNPSTTQTPSAPTTSNNSTTTAFDTIPQIAEARQYFQQRWQPPSGLTETLEYSIVLDSDGTIQRIEPLGQAARNYVDRSGMPLIGERFVSPVANSKSPRIRVVLNPDGQVQTFLE